jgi:hypothetical protein
VRVEGGDPVVAGLQLAQLEALHHAVVVTQLLNLIPLHSWDEVFLLHILHKKTQIITIYSLQITVT